MPQRKHTNTNRDIHPESQLLNEDTQEDAAIDDGEERVESSASLLASLSARDKQRKERKNKIKPKEMTEEEMMALALRLSAQEANVSALRVQQEEEAMMKAIKESMCSQSQSMLTEADTLLTCHSRHRRLLSNGVAESNINVTASGDCCTTGANLSQGKGQNNRNKKQKRKEGPTPELTQTHQICSQASPSSSESQPALLATPQSCDVTQIDKSQHHESPVFPMSTARVTFTQLNQGLVETCRTTGFVLCSQLNPELRMPERDALACRKSPLFSESDQGDDTEMLCHEYLKSPVFGRDTQQGGCQAGAGEAQVHSPERQNSDFTFSSQESLSPSTRLTSCPPKSPVFPRSPAPSKHHASSKNSQSFSESPVFLETDGEHVLSTNRGAAEELSDISKGTLEAELTSDMTLQWSEEDEEETLVSSPSPIFPEEGYFPPSEGQAGSQKQVAGDEATPETNTSSCSLSTQKSVSTQATVHYYWGVPFCPRGLDADAYTQVILAQMEVYEKSLKNAQRSLLRKAEWGDAIIPQTEKIPSAESSQRHKVPRRRGLRLRDKKLSDRVLVEPEEEEEEEEEQEEKQQQQQQQEEEEEKELEDDETDCGEGDQLDTDDCVVCPETQLSDEDLTDLSKPNSPECCGMVKRGADVAVDEEEMEVSTKGDEQANHLAGRNPTPANEEEEEQTSDGGRQRSPSPELDPVSTPQTSPKANVECPICQGTFPVGKIEMHAAYCDIEEGAAAVDENRPATEYLQVSLKPRKKRKRRAAEEEGDACSTGKIQEKCYICQKAMPLREFSTHTELCIRRQATKAPMKGNLLAALEHIESRDSAGPSRCKLEQRDIIDLRDDEEEGGRVSTLGISNSPIKSFTPISEATDCLIDFKRQNRLKKPSHKRR
ncbi:BRCA1-A complex subunit RAP80 isoform X2 [Dunckerocampus dactyliophorus]|uniref:BRCA1-A complex subunit RAP80 isoform X2 n=1 Tax=Dunckerocampus dactyliophorus TaxID=161453 RepID=UPI0024049CC5|nr:BRCA1-A complex subunit RAP80 isoform X2 [Dunckerocampus dactyliophorus]